MHATTTSTLLLDAGRHPFTSLHNIPTTPLPYYRTTPLPYRTSSPPSCADTYLGDSKEPGDAQQVSGSLAMFPTGSPALKRVRTVSGKVGRQMLERRKLNTPTPVTVDSGNPVLNRVRTVSGKVGRQMLERRKLKTPTTVAIDSGNSILKRVRTVSGKVGRQMLERRKLNTPTSVTVDDTTNFRGASLA